MPTQSDDTQLQNILGDLKAGRDVPPEMVDAAVKASNLDEDAVNARALVQTPVVEHEGTDTRHRREPLQVPEHIISGEEAAAEALQDQRVAGDAPSGSGSNDPEVNPAATGGEPFENESMVGTSGQVADPQSYKEGDTAPESDSKTTATSKSSK